MAYPQVVFGFSGGGSTQPPSQSSQGHAAENGAKAKAGDASSEGEVLFCAAQEFTSTAYCVLDKNRPYRTVEPYRRTVP